jgi:hypothetical protein
VEGLGGFACPECQPKGTGDLRFRKTRRRLDWFRLVLITVYRSRTLAKDVLNRLYSFIPVLNIELLQYYCSPFAPPRVGLPAGVLWDNRSLPSFLVTAITDKPALEE